MSLTPKQTRFVEEYLIDLNAVPGIRETCTRTEVSVGHRNPGFCATLS